MPQVDRQSFMKLGAGFTSTGEHLRSGDWKPITKKVSSTNYETREIDFVEALKEERLQEKAACEYICKNVLNKYTLSKIMGVTKADDLERIASAKKLQEEIDYHVKHDEPVPKKLINKQEQIFLDVKKNA